MPSPNIRASPPRQVAKGGRSFAETIAVAIPICKSTKRQSATKSLSLFFSYKPSRSSATSALSRTGGAPGTSMRICCPASWVVSIAS
eukprot:scaffold37642_cov30-Tisochrysis_lutea.AAC.7